MVSSVELDNVMWSFLDEFELETALSVLYGFVWTWGIIGKIEFINNTGKGKFLFL